MQLTRAALNFAKNFYDTLKSAKFAKVFVAKVLVIRYVPLTAYRDHKVQLVTEDHQALRDLQGQQMPRENPVLMDRMEMMEIQVFLAHKDHRCAEKSVVYLKS